MLVVHCGHEQRGEWGRLMKQNCNCVRLRVDQAQREREEGWGVTMALGGALGVRRAARAMEQVSLGPWGERQWVSACEGSCQPRSSHRFSAPNHDINMLGSVASS